MSLENIGLSEKSRYKDTVLFNSIYEISRINKSMETESRLVVSRGLMRGVNRV